MALAFKLSVLKKTHIWTQFNVEIPLNDAFLFQNKVNKILFVTPPPPPPRKKTRHRDANGCNMATHTCLFIPAACDLDFN